MVVYETELEHFRFPTRLRLGCATGYPGENVGPETWITVDAAICVSGDEYEMISELKFAEPLVFAINNENLTNDHLMFIEWNGSRLLSGGARWNKLNQYGTFERDILDEAFHDWELGRKVTWSRWGDLTRDYGGSYIQEVDSYQECIGLHPYSSEACREPHSEELEAMYQ